MSKLLLLSFAFVAVAASAAHADTPRSYVSVGGQLSGELNFTTGTEADVGIRAGDAPVLVHVGAAKGSFSGLEEAVGSNDDSAFIRGEGTYLKLRAGVEGESCSRSGIACGVYGVDAGFVDSSQTTGPFVDTPSAKYRQYQVVPRGGIDFGGRSLRVRVLAGLPIGATSRTMMDMTETRSHAALELSGAVAYRF
jgi:hypothetical protein